MENITAGMIENREGSTAAPAEKQEAAAIEMPKSRQELEKLLQQTADRRVNQAMETVKTKLEQEWSVKLEAEKAEAARLARMTESERFAALQQKRETELQKREESLSRRELRSTAMEQLVKRGLPGELAAALDYSSNDACQTSMEAVEKAFRYAVQEGINARLTRISGTPAAGKVEGDVADPFVRGFKK